MCVPQLLGVYTYTRKVTLDEFENKPRKQMVSGLLLVWQFDQKFTCVCVCFIQGYSTVSHFNLVHHECHAAAVK